MIGIAQGAQLTLQQDGFAFLIGLVQEQRGVAHHRFDFFRQRFQMYYQCVNINLRLMIEVV